MVYSYTQIAHYLRCPRSYRYRYLDGWREKDSRAGLLFGRCFEKALEAYFRGEDCAAALHQEWGAFRYASLDFKQGKTWDRMLHQGVHLLEKFARDNRVEIAEPRQNLQIKLTRELPNGNEFISFIDAIGRLDGIHCVIDWKTTCSRYPDEPAGLLALDPQLICYSWMTGMAEVALVVFVQKHQPEIQYLRVPSRRNNERNLIASSEPRLRKSKQPSSMPTAAFVFRRTVALAVPIWASVLAIGNSSKRI
jgi:hypothetical protein